MNTDKIKVSEKIAYGLGDMSSCMFWKLFGIYLMIFYTDVYGLPAVVVGTMFLITRLWDSAFDPFIGILADRTNTKHGKFRPYIKYLAIPFGIAGVLTFTTPDLSYTWSIVYAYVTYSFMMMIYSAINVPYASLLGVMSSNSKERTSISTYRMTFAYIGSFVSLLMFMPLVKYFKGNVKGSNIEQAAWQSAVIVISIICIILFFICYSFTKERVKPVKREKYSMKQDFKDIFHNKPWLILCGAAIFTLIFNSIRDGACVYYFKYYIVEEGYKSITIFGIPFIFSSLYLAIGQIANIVGVILATPISNKMGKRSLFMWAMILASLFSISFYWLGRENIILIFILQILISICAGSIFPLLWSMYADCADYSELKTGNRATGFIFSFSSMGQKFGWAIGTALTGWLLSAFGFKANIAQSPETINGSKLFLSFLPAIGCFISAIFIFFYPLSENKMLKINITLEKLRSN